MQCRAEVADFELGFRFGLTVTKCLNPDMAVVHNFFRV